MLNKVNKATKINKHLCQPCARKEIGKGNIGNTWGFGGKDMVGANHPRWNPNKPKYNAYKTEVYSVTRKCDLSILENYNMPRGLCGVDGAYQLDHIISIKRGFDTNISPEIIGNITNLQFIPWKENRTKWYK